MKKKTEKRRDGKVPVLRSIQTKYALTYILVVAAILLILNTYPVLKAQDMVFTSKESSLKRQALTIGSAIAVSETLTVEGVEQAEEWNLLYTGPQLERRETPVFRREVPLV